MPDYPVIEARPRDERGSRSMRRLRGEGLVPAVIYGANCDNQPLSVDAETLRGIIEQRARMVEVRIGSKSRPAVIKDIQFDHLDSEIQHVDFETINLEETMQIEVPIETHGTPRGVKNGGTMEVVHKRITVECKPADIPREITVEVADLEIGADVAVADLEIPDRVKVLDDPAQTVITVHAPRVAEEVAEVAEEELAEPEVISAKREEEEGGGTPEKEEK
ncbi:MAG: 50S ribosomal protein L25 [Planctomycetota bacterium]|jgi:large subunit ribosomal protein L25